MQRRYGAVDDQRGEREGGKIETETRRVGEKEAKVKRRSQGP
jgi:hypothetical protein